jgi:phenylacetate-CoA ligase
LARVRLVVSGEMASDAMTFKAECAAPSDALRERIGEAIRDVTKLRGDIEFCAVGSLPNDGKVIEDARSYK